MVPAYASLKELRGLLDRGEVTREELIATLSKRFAQYARLNTALELFDTNLFEGSSTTGKLAGIPGLIKDNICMKGRRMACASRMLEGYYAPYDATVITKLRQEGAVLLGRANMDEFAMGSSTEYSAFGPTKNPWNERCVPGGSSGGSVAAVAAGLVPWSLGSETGGSIRLPAAWCGVVGSKPTYGLVSRHGLTAYGSSLDQIGVITRTVADNALVLSVIAGHDEPLRDSTVRRQEGGYDFTQGLTEQIRPGLRIGVIRNAVYAPALNEEVRTAIRVAIDQLKALGAEIHEVELPSMDLSAATYFVVSRAEAASNLARFDGVRYGHRSSVTPSLEALYSNSRSEGFGEEVQRRILVGNYTLSHGHADAYYRRACEVRQAMREECKAAFAKVDLLVAPVAPDVAFEFGTFSNDPLQLDLQDAFTCFANLVGIPAISVPCGFTKQRLPIGFQFMGPHWSEQLLFRVAHAYEQATPWHTVHPEEILQGSSN